MPSTIEEGSATAKSLPLENFIPIRKGELVDLLAGQEELNDAERGDFRRVCQLLEATFHFEYHRLLEELKRAYAALRSRCRYASDCAAAEEESHRRLSKLFENFGWLLARANFQPLSRPDIERCPGRDERLGREPGHRFRGFDRLEVYVAAAVGPAVAAAVAKLPAAGGSRGADLSAAGRHLPLAQGPP